MRQDVPNPDQNSLLIELIRGQRDTSNRLQEDIGAIRQALEKDATAFHDFVQRSSIAQTQATSTMASMQTQIEALTTRQSANTQAIEELRALDRRRLAMVAGINIAIGGMVAVISTLLGWLYLIPPWMKSIIADYVAGKGGGSGP